MASRSRRRYCACGSSSNGADTDPVWPRGVAVRTYEPGDAEAVKRLLDGAYLAWDEATFR
jgi:hypothetical protein